MLKDTRVDAPPAMRRRPPASAADLGGDPGTGDSGITEELLVEDVSIDGMCGVY